MAEKVLILLVEDDEKSRNLFKDLLEVKGYQVLDTDKGKDALLLLQSNKPSLVLMDILLPDTNGLEIIKLIKANADMKDIPIIALTALAMKEDREKCLQAGCIDYISKPVSIMQLLDKIEKYLK